MDFIVYNFFKNTVLYTGKVEIIQLINLQVESRYASVISYCIAVGVIIIFIKMKTKK